MKNHEQRLSFAKKSLTGISIGDAFGDSFFGETNSIKEKIRQKEIPDSSLWEFTDDTVMAIPIYKSLEQFQEINPDYIAQEFANNYAKDNNRGYGPSMHRKLKSIKKGEDWLELSTSSFNGQGSMGNGGAMRVALIGAYFYDDLEKTAQQAKLSCQITHYHVEAVAGAISVAIATSLCTRMALNQKISKEEWLDTIIEFTPESDLLYKLKKIKTLPANYDIETIVWALGNGIKMTATDTVPYAIWNVLHSMHHFENCLWKTVSGLGDRDTNCAIAGGISILCSAKNTIPNTWKKNVEKWENSIFYKEKEQ